MPTVAQPPRVLILGRRKRLESVLTARGVPFALWLNRDPPKLPRSVPTIVAPFVRSRAAVEATLSELLAGEQFTHCIASVEAAVVTASHARRVLGARTSPHTVARRCHDKLIMKRALREAGVPVAEFLDLGRRDERARIAELGRPLVVKDRVSSGSRGVEIVTGPIDPATLPRRGYMAERFVSGDEMSVESFVHNGKILWTNTTRYWRPKFVNVVPSGLDTETEQRVLDVNRHALEALSVRWGMTHLELFLGDEGIFVGEVALRPPGGYIMRCLELAYGFDPWNALCALELGERARFPTTPPRPTAVVVLHPGEGRVNDIRGLDAVRAHPAHVHSALKVEAGADITERAGVGEDVGHVLLQADTQRALDEAIRFVDAQLTFDIEPLAPSE